MSNRYLLTQLIRQQITLHHRRYVGIFMNTIKPLFMVRRSNTMMLIPHDSALLISLCMRFICSDHGRLIADGDIKVLQAYLQP